MGWDRPRKRKKNFSPEFRSYTVGEENSEINTKKLKNLFPALFLAKTGFDRPRKKKKNLVPNSVITQPDVENSKKNSKKIKKIKKPLSGIISIQNGLLVAEKEEKKKFSPEFRSYPTRARKLKKNLIKFKKLKNLIPALFWAKTEWDGPRKRRKKI